MGTTVAFAVMACGTGGTGSTNPTAAPTSSSQSTTGTTTAVDTKSAAADLRTKLNILLGEHLIIASKATGAALGGRSDEFKAYGDLLAKNGTDIGDMIGAAYGSDAKDQFNKIWSAHNGFFVDYTVGVATKDQAKKDAAVKNLTTVYVPQFSQFIAGATGLPVDTVAQLTTTHVTTTAGIVDAQAAKDWPTTYTNIRKAYAHMRNIGDPLSESIAKKLASKFPGDAANKGVDLRVSLNLLLQEHLYLASDATGAALGGRNDEFKAAADALNQNGTDIGAAIGSLYGTDAQAQFNKIWSAHNGFFVDYTVGTATSDKAKKDKAVQDLTTVYVPQFAAFLAGATGLPQDTLAQLTTTHVTTTAGIVDAQGAKDVAGAATKDRAAAQHMENIADPLADAIVKKLPAKFAA